MKAAAPAAWTDVYAGVEIERGRNNGQSGVHRPGMRSWLTKPATSTRRGTTGALPGFSLKRGVTFHLTNRALGLSDQDWFLNAVARSPQICRPWISSSAAGD
jgi:hypothetical protein